MNPQPIAVDVRRGDFHLAVTLDPVPGEVLAIVGPNGAGKTTLLRALAGLEGPTPVGTPRVGMVFQDYRLFPHLRVLDNVAFGPRSRGVSRATARATARVWLQRLELDGLAMRRPGQLSGGQAQRVALARALANEPALLLLDEPLSALDAQGRLDVRRELRRQLADFAGPTLLVTHDPLEALVLADRIVVLEAGRITQVGTPAEVARRPRTPFVARLVGVNLLSGHVRTDGIEIDGGGVVHAAEAPDATDVLVSLRPSSITLHRHRPETSSRNVWEGVVRHLELLGDRVRVEVEGQPEVLVDVTPAAVADLGLATGTPVWLSAKATDVEVYRAF